MPDVASSSVAPVRLGRWTLTPLWVGVLVGLGTGLLALARAVTEPGFPTDFDQLWVAARGLASGRNPYLLVGPGREFQWDWPLYYPLPAVISVLPFAPLPVAAARVVFATVGGGVLAYALARTGFERFPLFLSASFLIATWRTQWSPLLTAAIFIPALGVFLIAKPNIGLGVLAALDGRRALLTALVGMAAIALLSFVWFPSWPAHWRIAIDHSPHIRAPVAQIGGPLLLLAVIRWRRRDARLLAVMSCVPHTPSLYDLLPLFLVARTRRESMLLALLSHALFAAVVTLGPFASFDLYAAALGRLAIPLMYIPALIMILRRPNLSDDSDISSAAYPAAGSRRFSPMDAVLLASLVTCAAFLTWVTVATRRI